VRRLGFTIAVILGFAVLAACGSSEEAPQALTDQGTLVPTPPTDVVPEAGGGNETDLGPRTVGLVTVDPGARTYLRSLTGLSAEQLPALTDQELDCLATQLDAEGLGAWVLENAGDAASTRDFAGAPPALQDAVGVSVHRCVEPASAAALLTNASIDAACFDQAVTNRDMVARVFSVVLVVDPEAGRFDDEAWVERMRCLDTERLTDLVIAQGADASAASCYTDRLFRSGEVTHKIFHRHRVGIEPMTEALPTLYETAELECFDGRPLSEIGSSQ
jgi:hypothetical protein